jgi:lysophospholipase L1-like esterase
MMRKAVLAGWLVLVPLTGVHAADVAIKNGDVIVFLGDDVAEEYGGAQRPDRLAYPTLVESFLTVRYPDVHASYYNDAMAGATAATTLERLKRDVLPQKPTVAVICLGLRDAGMRPFDQALLDAHKAAMQKLVAALKAAGCRVYIMSPPSVDEQAPGSASLQQVKYNDTLARYAAAQKEIASAEGAQFVDWFDASTAARQKGLGGRPDSVFSPDGLRHSLRSNAFAATLLLEAFHAEPVDVEINMDWNSDSIQCNAGQATLTTAPDGSRVIHVAKLPLPWPSFIGQADMFTGDWEAAKWCRYVLKVANAPATGVMLSDGDRQVPILQQQLTVGLNLAGIEPLRSLQGAQDLSNLIRRKNYTRTHAWRDQELQPIREPELVEAQKALIGAWYKYFAGYEKMINRMPKTFDLTVRLAELKLNLPTTGPAAGPVTPPPTPPTSTPAAK